MGNAFQNISAALSELKKIYKDAEENKEWLEFVEKAKKVVNETNSKASDDTDKP